jgi:Fe-S-cluster containining protein
VRRYLDPDTVLPLTCTRSGTCCHGKDISLTPAELARLATANGMSATDFRAAHTSAGGTRLRMSGPPGWRGLAACSQYDAQRGCRVHPARPLACRLYPLGRERAGERERFFHEGERFPCLDGCPEVTSLPRLSVADYLRGQEIADLCQVRDTYLEIAQDLAEGAFVLVFDSGLSESGSGDWRQRWQAVADGGPEAWIAALGSEWHDLITVPDIGSVSEDAWVPAHARLLQSQAQERLASLTEQSQLAAASATLLAGAVLLLHGVGADSAAVARAWLVKAGVLRG